MRAGPETAQPQKRSSRAPAYAGTQVIGATGAIDLASRDPGETRLLVFCTHDRTITVPVSGVRSSTVHARLASINQSAYASLWSPSKFSIPGFVSVPFRGGVSLLMCRAGRSCQRRLNAASFGKKVIVE
jgi:hypothetical protein